MTVKYDSAISRRQVPEFCLSVLPSSYRGRSATPRGEQGMPGADAPAAARGVIGSTRVSHHGHTGITRHSPRNGFNSLFRALPGDRAFLPPSLAKVAFRQLDASIGASGPHDFAVRASAARLASLPRPLHPAPTFVTMANAPLIEVGRGELVKMICPTAKAKYFRKEGWTGFSQKQPVGQITP